MSQLKHYLWLNVILCTKMDTSFKIIHHNNDKEAFDEISLSYEERFIRRKKLIANNGTEFLVNLEETVSVDENHFFELENGKIIKVFSKEENLIEITGNNLKQIIWHIGNRHLPCQIEENTVILDMVLKLHGNVKKVFEKFKPEGGAYGMGRTHSHKH